MVIYGTLNKCKPFLTAPPNGRAWIRLCVVDTSVLYWSNVRPPCQYQIKLMLVFLLCVASSDFVQIISGKVGVCYCCDRKSRAACAQSFAPWQQATKEITRRDHSIITCSHHAYIFLFFAHIPFVVNHTINATPPERLQHYTHRVLAAQFQHSSFISIKFSDAVFSKETWPRNMIIAN